MLHGLASGRLLSARVPLFGETRTPETDFGGSPRCIGKLLSQTRPSAMMLLMWETMCPLRSHAPTPADRTRR